MINVILQEDDCDPYAFECFEHAFKEQTGMTVTEFKKAAVNKSTYYEHVWVKDNLELSYAADYPFHILKDLSHE